MVRTLRARAESREASHTVTLKFNTTPVPA
jgi:hypothetical protein